MEKVTGEVININNKYHSYQDYKAAVDAELQNEAESFVRTGYLLKLARDTDILKESGYTSVNEFAWTEYHLDKSQVSRYIRINDEYSENGYSDKLQEKYQRFGYAKLALMLNLPSSINEELSADYSKREIQTIKEEVDGERRISDLEVMMEGENQKQKLMDSTLKKSMYQIGHDYPETYIQLHECIREIFLCNQEEIVRAVKRIKEILAPAGENVYSIRIQGLGKMMVFFKEAESKVSIINVRTNEKEYFTWVEVIEAVKEILNMELEEKASWEDIYGEPYPQREEPKAVQKEKVAPVQPKTEKKKPDKVKTSIKKTVDSKLDSSAKCKEEEKENEPTKTKEESGNALTTIAREEISSPAEETDSIHSDIESDTTKLGAQNEHIEDEITKIYDDAYDLASALEEYFIDEKKKMTQKDLEEMKYKSEQLTKVIEQLILLVKEQS